MEEETAANALAVDNAAQMREQFSRLTRPSDNATQALQTGFVKLKRVCDYGLHEKTASTGTEGDLRMAGERPLQELASVQRALEQIGNAYRQASRITKNASCKYAPVLQYLTQSCRGFYEDSDRLMVAGQAAQRLVSQTRERLKLYGQYEVLELQGCTRAGFTQKLWANEEKYLWPMVMGAPAVFKALLPSASEN